MYRILYNDSIIFDPYGNDNEVVTDASMSVEINAAAYMDFTMSRRHPLYNTIAERDGVVTLYWDGDILFQGVIESIDMDINGNKSISCVSALDYLNDTVVRPYSTIAGEQELTAPSSVNGYFQWLIDQHNKHVLDSRKRFYVGVNQGEDLQWHNFIYRSSTNNPTTASEISDQLLGTLGGYLIMKYVDGRYVLNLYSSLNTVNSQIIDFGVNITDFSKTVDTKDQYTALILKGGSPEFKGGSFESGDWSHWITHPNEPLVGDKTHGGYLSSFFVSGIGEYVNDSFFYFRRGRRYRSTVYVKNERESNVTIHGSYQYEQSGMWVTVDSGTSLVVKNEGDNWTEFTFDFMPDLPEYSKIRPRWYFDNVPNDGNRRVYLDDFSFSQIVGDTDVSEDPINISMVPDGGTQYDSNILKTGDVIYDTSSVLRYGYKEEVYEDSTITNVNDLLQAGIKELIKLKSPQISLDIKAVDLSMFMKEYTHLNVGDIVRVRSAIHDIDEYLMVNSINLDLQDPGQSEYSIGKVYDSLTGQQSGIIRSLNSGINSSFDSIASLDQTAKDHAVQISSTQQAADQAQNTATNAQSTADNAQQMSNANKEAIDSIKSNQTEYENQLKLVQKDLDDRSKDIAAVDRRVDNVSSGLASAQSDISELKIDVSDATTKADQASKTANEAKTTAESALTQSNTALQTANSVKTELETNYSTTDKIAKQYATKSDVANTYLTKGNASNTYLTKSDASNTYLTKSDASSTYSTKNEVASTYLTKGNASNTYLTKSDASNTYATKSMVEQTANSVKTELETNYSTTDKIAKQYATKSDVANTYLTKGNASNTYLTKSDASNTYLTKSDASSTYSTKNEVASTYLTKGNASNTYLTKSDASNTYATKSMVENIANSVKTELETNYSTTDKIAKQYATKATVESLENIANSVKTELETNYSTTDKIAKQYATKSDVANTYLTKGNASNTYLTKSDASNTYLTKSDASSTYSTKNEVASTYLTKGNASNTYLTKSDASNTYATKSMVEQTSQSITSSVEATYATKATVESLENIANNAVQTWMSSGVPTLSNKPASDWTTSELKSQHSGDVYYDSNTGYSYRFGSSDGKNYSWALVKDVDITKAIADAAKAQQTANGAQSGVNELKTSIPTTYATKTELTQKADSITTRVEEVAQAGETTSNKVSGVEQSLNSFKSTVSQTYETKTDALSKKSELEHNLDSFKTTVSQTYTTKTDFNNLQIGGTNRALLTSTPKTVTGNGGANQYMDLYAMPSTGYELFGADDAMISYDITASGNTLSGTYIIQGNGQTGWQFVGGYPSRKLSDIGNGNTLHVEDKVKFGPDSFNNFNGLVIRMDNASGALTISNLKIEKGNKATTWSPAPEDIEQTYATKTSLNTLSNRADITYPMVSISNANNYWIRLGTATIIDQGRITQLTLNVSKGNNGQPSQNAKAIIQIHRGWDGGDANHQFGVSVDSENWKEIQVKAISNETDKVTIWVYNSVHAYFKGNYTVSGWRYSWEDQGLVQTDIPTGTEQQVAINTNLENVVKGISTNLIKNPGFETGDLEQWVIDGGMSNVFVNNQSPHGDSYKLLIHTPSTSSWTMKSNTVTVVKNHTYEISCWVWADKAVNAKLGIYAGGNYVMSDVAISASSSWQRISVRRTLKNGYSDARISFGFPNAISESNNIRVDDFELRDITEGYDASGVANSALTKASSLEQTLNEFKTTVSQTYAPKASKLIWSGNVNKGGNFTCSEAPYYNVFAARLDADSTLMLGIRSELNSSSGSITLLGTDPTAGSYQGLRTCSLTFSNETSVTVTDIKVGTSNDSSKTLTELWGIL